MADSTRMQVVRRLGLRWILPMLQVLLTASLLVYGQRLEKEIYAPFEKSGFRLVRHPAWPTETAVGLNFPVVSLVLLTVPRSHWDSIANYILAGALVIALWWWVGSMLDRELRLGRWCGMPPHPWWKRPLAIVLMLTLLIVATISVIARAWSPRFLGAMWYLTFPTLIVTTAVAGLRSILRRSRKRTA